MPFIKLKSWWRGPTQPEDQPAKPEKSKTDVPTIPSEIRESLGIDKDADISALLQNGQMDLLDRTYNVLKAGSDATKRPLVFRCLQDFCYYFNSLPKDFQVRHVSFSRAVPMGRGGEATTYRGQMAGQEVVVREMFLTAKEWSEPGGQEVARLVHREAITHSQLNHNHILPFKGVYHESIDSPPLTIVPYIDGGSLQSVLTPKELLSMDSFKQILIGINKGVGYLHSRQPPVIHGDLHPGNVLLDKYQQPYLCDFGLSRVRHEVSRTRTQRQDGGSTRFSAPELTSSPADKFRTTSQSDIYALAMLTYNMWTGQKPFSEIELEWQVALTSVQGGRPRRPTASTAHVNLAEGVEAAFWRLLQEMWAQDPSKRPVSDIVLSRFEKIFEGTVSFEHEGCIIM
ncbi:kinase-like protein [Clavulina sp. PMI_390]|nr:kinase-like protein [Clavulina sp. PMI_390]